MTELNSEEELLAPGAVARKCGVSVATIGRYADRGLLPFVALPNGQRRYRTSDVQALIDGVMGSAD